LPRLKSRLKSGKATTEVALRFERQGGKTAAKNMTREERLARAKKAAKAAAEQRTAKRLHGKV
jgi:hypothetical protein